MNLWILHYSFINHHFHCSTITIKQKIIINKLVTELLWGHFLWKNSCSNEKRQITRHSAAKRRIPRPNSMAQFHGKNPNSAAWLEIPRAAENCGPYWYDIQPLVFQIGSPTFGPLVFHIIGSFSFEQLFQISQQNKHLPPQLLTFSESFCINYIEN